VRWGWGVAGIVLLVAACGGGTTPSTSAGDAAARDATSSSSAPGFDDGVNLVGTEIEPGLYEIDDTHGCVGARLSSADPSGLGVLAYPGPPPNRALLGDLSSIGLMTGHFTVEIRPTDVSFFSYHCGHWSKAVPDTPREQFTDGVWKVGTDIKPGLYRGENPGYACRWARVGELTSLGVSIKISPILIDSKTPEVQIAPSDGAFEAKGCGTFTFIG
jgi:hypothetical protein